MVIHKECRAFSINSCLCTNWIVCTDTLKFLYKHILNALDSYMFTMLTCSTNSNFYNLNNILFSGSNQSDNPKF